MLVERVIIGAIEVPGWSLPEWLTVIGFPAVLIALVLGVRHLGEAKKQSTSAATAAGHAQEAAEAAKVAIEQTQSRLADIQLVSLLHQLTDIRGGLDEAIRYSREDDAIRHLGNWVVIGSQARGILARHTSTLASELTKNLFASVALSGDAKDDILDKKLDLDVATRRTRGAMTRVCSDGMSLARDLQSHMPDSG